MKIKLIADSTCDIPDDLIAQLDIRIAPLSISMGDKIYKDGKEVTSSDIFNFTDTGKGICRTSAVNIAEYSDIYAQERPNCDAILHFIISKDMSACYQNAQLAAQDYDNIFIIDTRNLSSAMGLLILDATDLISEGRTPEEIYNEITRRIPLQDAGFIIDTLQYLHKGGRCTSIQALASSVLKIKPSITVKDGHMSVGKKYRGNLENILRKYIQDRLHNKQNIDTRRIFIANTMTTQNQALVAQAKSIINEIMQFDQVYETPAGGTISCHCGPNTLGIFFSRKT